MNAAGEMVFRVLSLWNFGDVVGTLGTLILTVQSSSLAHSNLAHKNKLEVTSHRSQAD
jgi:hypothetical protein